jgi:hypothetical protein
VGLYALQLLLLTLPVCLLCGLQWHREEHQVRWDIGLDHILQLLQTGWYWLWLGVFVLGQTLLLLVPVAVAEGRPRSRRKLRVAVITTTFLLANLFFAGVCAALAACRGDEMFEGVELPLQAISYLTAHIPWLRGLLAGTGITLSDEWIVLMNLIGLVLFFWLAWGLIFYHYAKADEPETLMQRATRWLLRGSILELLVAVPSHILVRSRTECCAPFASFWGIATGLSVMLLSFGPGVLFLFARRLRDRRPKNHANNAGAGPRQAGV